MLYISSSVSDRKLMFYINGHESNAQFVPKTLKSVSETNQFLSEESFTSEPPRPTPSYALTPQTVPQHPVGLHFLHSSHSEARGGRSSQKSGFRL